MSQVETIPHPQVSDRPTPQRKPLIVLVAAMAHQRVIGRDNRLPWHLPADLAHFKRLTLDRPILMGRRTFDSLPGLLPRRRHIVISRDPGFCPPGCEVVGSPDAALAAVAGEPEVMVVGGASIYRAMLPLAQRMELTLIDADIPGDTQFPHWDASAWREVTREHRLGDDRNAYAMDFVRLERLSA
ncbi:dihydrofolate reductase [Thiohalocapsa marina]|uniref:Dihydrofolate reductase n=1 Tax=Thiohalocapsa marina TaxID=424902 RepID=A0A5M8FVT9_9GAMM|nr:dihydrofolate reductase [Thiohalocapsa marina]KAA6187819.1 dihydrofolate reductase [Thiohalocapsa marina]